MAANVRKHKPPFSPFPCRLGVINRHRFLKGVVAECGLRLLQQEGRSIRLGSLAGRREATSFRARRALPPVSKNTRPVLASGEGARRTLGSTGLLTTSGA